MSLVVKPSTVRVGARAARVWTVRNISLYALLLLLTMAMLLPLLFVLATALKSDTNILEIPPTFWPKEFKFSNFSDAFTKLNFGQLFLNSVLLSALNVLGSVASSMVIAYGLSRIRLPGRAIWFYLFIGSMMLPNFVSLFPLFKLYLALGWYGTWWPLIVPAFFGNPFFIFLMRQYYLSIPRTIDEAAMIDGASHWQIFTRIMAPLTSPAWIACAVFAFQGAWTNYLDPLIYVPLRPDLQPLALGLMNLSSSSIANGMTNTPWNIFMAANLLFMIPSVVVFFFAQNYFMQGVGAIGSRTQK